jgi:phage baseplate assembly protein W
LLLGSFAVDDTGDYAFDDGLTNFKKRILRRLIYRKGSFPHMPEYGVGVPAYVKQLSIAATRGRLAAEAQQQISREPDCVSCTVDVVTDKSTPNLVRFLIVATTHKGQTARFDVPFVTT